MATTDTTRLAVLIDSDNTSYRHGKDILEEIAKYGTPTIKRAYGDWTTQHLVGWKDEMLQNAIQPVQQFAYTRGKNSTDSALIIDAMDLLYAGHVEGFVLVSSDSDFTRLATRLRESGMTVYGVGRRNTPESFVKACDRFIYLDLFSTAPTEPPGPPGPPESAKSVKSEEPEEPVVTEPAPPDLRRILTTAVNGASSQEDGWASLAAVGSHIVKNNPSFDPRDYGFAKLGDLARAQNFVDVESPATGPVRIRLRSARPAKKAAPAKKASSG